MDTKKKKKELEKKFNQINQQIQQLVLLKEQLRGKWQMLDELEKAEKKNA
jgi:peptidoglycan hydrolase CwlO-like protein